jgi:transglutaminase-like putative cysteine protease
VALCCLFAFSAFSQDGTAFPKFGKISAEDIQKKTYQLDTSANAIVLSDVGEASIEGNSKNWFSIVLKRHKVVHILNKNGYDEANVQIPLYSNGDQEEILQSVKAVTYNLVNGKVVATKLSKDDIFKEKIDKNRVTKKFTFPGVKEGCIIEYEYKVISDFIWNLDPWLFQSTTAPTLWTEFTLSVPQFFTYNFLSRGYERMYISDSKDRVSNFTIQERRGAGATENYNFTSGVTDYRWAMRNVPELKEESFTSSIKNHVSRMEFQLASQSPPLTPHNYRSSWEEVTKSLIESESFGANLKSNNNWLGDDLKPVFASANDNEEKAKKIFIYVRDNFACTGNAGIYMDQSLKNVFKSKKGSVAELNLLLTAMLQYAGLDAQPVILSTTRNGYVVEYSPIVSQFNYVVVQVKNIDKTYYLDASDGKIGFNKLPAYCYNGHARVVNESATPLKLSADELKESKASLLLISNEEGGGWAGRMSQTLGENGSYDVRSTVKEKGQEEFFKQVKKDFLFDVELKNAKIDSLTQYNQPVKLQYRVEFNINGEDILYVNPMFGEGYSKNPFNAAERVYPVEMPYASDEVYVLNMEVPNGYVVDELPKQMLAKFDEAGKTFFEYRISQTGNSISFRSRIRIDKAFFMPEEYPTLREFFKLIVSKQSEQIVFKKKK